MLKETPFDTYYKEMQCLVKVIDCLYQVTLCHSELFRIYYMINCMCTHTHTHTQTRARDDDDNVCI